jgi:hypothetical protein
MLLSLAGWLQDRRAFVGRPTAASPGWHGTWGHRAQTNGHTANGPYHVAVRTSKVAPNANKPNFRAFIARDLHGTHRSYCRRKRSALKHNHHESFSAAAVVKWLQPNQRQWGRRVYRPASPQHRAPSRGSYGRARQGCEQREQREQQQQLRQRRQARVCHPQQQQRPQSEPRRTAAGSAARRPRGRTARLAAARPRGVDPPHPVKIKTQASVDKGGLHPVCARQLLGGI